MSETAEQSGAEKAYLDMQERRKKALDSQFANGEWPLVGEKLKFKGADGFFYPHYTNVIDNAKKMMVVGQAYTVRKCEVYSSWCAIWLEEFPGDFMFHLPMFERASRYDTIDVMIQKLKALGYDVNKKEEK